MKKSLAKVRGVAGSCLWEKMHGRRQPGKVGAMRIAAAMTWLLLSGCTNNHVSFLDPQGPIADIQRKHFLEMLALLGIFVALPVFVLIPWFAWRYRYGSKSSRYTPQWSFFRPLEIASWFGPIVIVALLGVLVWRSTHALDPYKPLPSTAQTLSVQVIGYDWKWLFIYPDQGVASIGVLAMPVGRPLTMQLTSATVMQSLQIPALGSQIYAMGGMVTQLNLEASKAGHFMGENTMFNGDGFHQQKFTAVAMTPRAFDDWVQHIRTTGVPLDTAMLKLIAQRTTRAQLVRALSKGPSSDDNLYFIGVTPALFPAVVKATVNGALVMPADPGNRTTTTAVPVARKSVGPVIEKGP